MSGWPRLGEPWRMNGIYALKPWYAARLRPVRRALVARRVPPSALTWTGVGFGGAAGAAVALLHPGPVAALAAGILLAARLGCANLDGGVARESRRTTRFGVVTNELGDRLAELAALAGLLAVAPAAVVAGAALAATLPSWIALVGAAAGAPRRQGGPVGKTERCALIVIAAGTGAVIPALAVLVAGSLLTAALRLRFIARFLKEK
jgi:CDP-diacylglycerol--glycerol-3-phosphate 3-phosphatidyltransferase